MAKKTVVKGKRAVSNNTNHSKKKTPAARAKSAPAKTTKQKKSLPKKTAARTHTQSKLKSFPKLVQETSSTKLDLINKKLDQLIKEQEALILEEKRVRDEERKVEFLEEKELKGEANLERLERIEEKELQKVEALEQQEVHELEELKALEDKIKKEVEPHPLAKITIRDLFKGSIGAFIGLVFHLSFVYVFKVAEHITVIRASFLFLLSFIMGAIIIYATGFRKITEPKLLIFWPLRLMILYLTALLVSLVVLAIFEPHFGDTFASAYAQTSVAMILAMIGATTADLIGRE